MRDTTIIIPTLNEEEIIASTVRKITRQGFKVIVIDDSSDKTALIARKAGAVVIARKNKSGIGSALKQGFSLVESKNVVFMDADLSHHPSYIQKIVHELENNDLVVCSRFIKGGYFGQSKLRILGTKSLNMFTRKYLGLSVNDCTNGFLGARVEKLRQIILYSENKGVDPFQDLFQTPFVFAANILGMDVKEIPADYINRRSGKSKVSGFALGFRHLRLIRKIKKVLK